MKRAANQAFGQEAPLFDMANKAVRTEFLRHVYETCRAKRAKTKMFPARNMDSFVAENHANIAARPDATNSVQPSPAAFERLQGLAQKYGPLLFEKVMPIGLLPDIEDLCKQFMFSYRYIPFDDVLSALEATVNHTVRVLSKEHSRDNDGRMLYFLALPNGQIRSSNLWFSSYAWAHTGLKDLVDYIVPSMKEVVRFLAIANDTNGGPPFHATVFYVDDMAYSGDQIWSFFHQKYSINVKHITFVPLVPFMTDKARALLQEQQVKGQISVRMFLTDIVSTPDDYRVAMGAKEFDIDVDYVTTMFKYMDFNRLDDMKYCFHLLGLFHKALTYPSIIFEHKMADGISICWELFAQIEKAPGETDTNPRALVTIGNGTQSITEDGSSAFYKTLKWYYKTQKLKDATPLSTLASALAMCVTCDAPAVSACAACYLAFYCADPACRTTHWTQGLHSQVCDH